MRPYKEEEGKTPKKRQHTKRGQKAINGVKKSLVKAKVSAVKTKKRIQAGGKNGDEVEDLLEQTANGGPSTPIGKAVIRETRTTRASSAAKQMKKLKSLVQVAANGNNDEVGKRQREASKTTNGSVEVAMEATEVNGKSGSLLQRTISKIWRIPEGITGVPYSDIQSSEAPASPEKKAEPMPANGTNGDTKAANGCIIS